MTDILARLRVKEEHGIRRFLYPLSATVPFESYDFGDGNGPVFPRLRVADAEGRLLPSQPVLPSGAAARLKARLDFAVSLAPFEEQELRVVLSEAEAPIPDALRPLPGHIGLATQQERVQFHIGPEANAETGLFPKWGALRSVVYDGVEYLAGPLAVTVKGWEGGASVAEGGSLQHGPLTSRYDYGRWGCDKTRYELTACKSWVLVSHRIDNATPGMQTRFSLPLSAVENVQTCDFGVGSGVYAKVTGERTIWRVEFGKSPFARWRVGHVIAETERVDYIGEAKTSREFAGQAWFHWIDGTKSLAVALTHIPRGCRMLTASLDSDGVLDILYQFGDAPAKSADFSVCYHFLNDVPAIAAATNPQSILLPPTVEVLP